MRRSFQALNGMELTAIGTAPLYTNSVNNFSAFFAVRCVNRFTILVSRTRTVLYCSTLCTPLFERLQIFDFFAPFHCELVSSNYPRRNRTSGILQAGERLLIAVPTITSAVGFS